MLSWLPIAMVRILAFLIAGILLAHWLPWQITMDYAQAIPAALFGVYLLLGRHTVWRGSIGLLCVSSVGYVIAAQYEEVKSGHLCRQTETYTAYLATVKSYPSKKRNGYTAVAEVSQIKTSTQWQPAHGKISFRLDSASGDVLGYGDVLLVLGMPQRSTPPPNPYVFDYQQYLANQKIYFLHTLTEKDFIKINQEDSGGAYGYAYRCRKWLISRVYDYVPTTREQEVILGVLLGITSSIDAELMDAFSHSGTLHVLSVSGFHVGVIFLLISSLFSFLGNTDGARWFRCIMVLVGLWAFAFVSGLAPATVRAVVMLSFLSVGQAFRLHTNPYNTLATAAFFMLLYNPFLLFNIGFQLSFTAVFGLLYFYPKISTWQKPKYRVLRWIWSTIAASLSAQLATTLLSLYYFHQFPVYFLLFNIAVAACVFLLIVAALVFIALCSVPIVGAWAGKFVFLCSYLLNETVLRVEDLPYYVVSGIRFSGIELACYAITVSAACLLWQRKHMVWLYAACLSGIAGVAARYVQFTREVMKDRWVVHRGYMDIISLQKQGQIVYYAPNTPTGNDDIVRKKVNAPYAAWGGLEIRPLEETARPAYLDSGVTLLSSGGAAIAFVHNRLVKPLPAVDYIVISRQGVIDFEKQIPAAERLKKIVLTSSNSPAYCLRLSDYALRRHIAVHHVKTQGDFIAED